MYINKFEVEKLLIHSSRKSQKKRLDAERTNNIVVLGAQFNGQIVFKK